uniref:Putative secreted peptide n=1 Tax=Anopheles braziliensis TaxID=58242 RepID=A0A2M3ZWZ5_9DIPT
MANRCCARRTGNAYPLILFAVRVSACASLYVCLCACVYWSTRMVKELTSTLPRPHGTTSTDFQQDLVSHQTQEACNRCFGSQA